MARFDKPVDRRDSDCMKFDGVRALYNKDDLIPMWVADMDFCAPNEVLSALKLKVEHGIFGYPGNLSKYYQAIIDWMEKRHNWRVEQEWIFPAPGVVPAIASILEELTTPNDKVIIQPPVYHPFLNIVKKVGCEVLENPLIYRNNRYEMDYGSLEEMIDERVKVLLLCSPHNPVGRVWNKEELKKLGDICSKYNIIVISDEIHHDLVFPKNKHWVFAQVDENFVDNTIVCTAPSKTFNLAGLQTANVIVPGEKLREKVQHKFSTVYNSFPNVMGIEATKAAYTYGDNWLDELLDYVKGNLEYLEEFIEKNLQPVKVIKPEGTYLVWLDFDEVNTDGLTAFDFVLKKAGVVSEPGEKYGGSTTSIRLNLACHRETLQKALFKIEEAINKPTV
ncbi:MalY/PatB family protein [Proteinivorax tanatarense]|uniref:cysteine-S-conjugate beta-lyase n=1 Tax=Proteinivorax tanatarense TaxID=1260629 RepID=A0AAU7VL38_9FIRM